MNRYEIIENPYTLSMHINGKVFEPERWEDFTVSGWVVKPFVIWAVRVWQCLPTDWVTLVTYERAKQWQKLR